MNGLSIFCPECGSTFGTGEVAFGQNISCPDCSADLVANSDGAGGVVASPASGKAKTRPEKILVTSGSLNVPHEILGVVCFCLGTRGGMAAQFDHLKQALADRIASVGKGLSGAQSVGQVIGGIGIDSQGNIDFGGQYAGATFQSNDPEIAFHIAISQLQLRASYLRADAVVGYRYDLDLDSNSGVLNFMAFAYGTAVRMIAN